MTTALDTSYHRRSAAAALVAVLALLTGSCSSASDGTSSSAAPVAATSPSTAPSTGSHTIRMVVAGTEESGGDGLGLSAELPPGWQAHNGPYAANTGSAQPTDEISFFVSVVDNTFKDPCAHVETLPKIGPSLDDLTAALGGIPGITATKPKESTLAGQPATYVELTIPGTLPCDPEQFVLWQDSPDNYWWLLGADETVGVWIVDVAGERVAVTTRTYSRTAAARKAELQTILDSIVFDPAA